MVIGEERRGEERRGKDRETKLGVGERGNVYWKIGKGRKYT